jgi:hypothetical protein
VLNLAPTIESIKVLLAEDTDQSVTYAALEARLGLELVVYDRLRQRHDYISHEQLRKWQPGAVINQLIADVDAHVTQTMSLHIGGPSSEVKPEDDHYVEIGTEIGFDAKKIAKMWNALAKLALHVKLPKNKADHIARYGDRAKIKAKVEEALAALEEIATGTMTFSGFGAEVSFQCDCGETNKRRAALLKEGQRVFCFNPECKASWTVRKQGDDFIFHSETCDFACQGCGHMKHLPWRFFYEMKFGDRATFECTGCGHRNYVEWRLTQVAPASEVAAQKGRGSAQRTKASSRRKTGGGEQT